MEAKPKPTKDQLNALMAISANAASRVSEMCGEHDVLPLLEDQESICASVILSHLVILHGWSHEDLQAAE